MDDIWELLVAVFLVLVAVAFMLVTVLFPNTLFGGLSLWAALIFFVWGVFRGICAIVNHNDGKKE